MKPMKKYCSESSSIGKLAILTGLFVVAPLIVVFWYPKDAKYALSFLLPGGGSILAGPDDVRPLAGRTPMRHGLAHHRWDVSLTVAVCVGLGALIGALLHDKRPASGDSRAV